MSRRILLDESLIARLFHPRRDFVDRIVPRNILPFGATGSAHQGLQQAPIVHDLLLQRGTLRAQRAAVGRMIGVALDVHHLRGHILRAVANRVDDGAATHRAVRASRARLAAPRYLQRSQLRVGGLQIKTENGRSGASNSRQLQEVTAGWGDGADPPPRDVKTDPTRLVGVVFSRTGSWRY